MRAILGVPAFQRPGVIGLARVILAVVALLAVLLDPLGVRVPAILLAGYALYGVAILLRARQDPTLTVRYGLTLHLVDLAWAVVITFLTEGPSSPYFVFFIFVLLSAAYRWGFRETLATGVFGMVAIIGQFAFLSFEPGWNVEPLEVNRLIIRCVYLLLVAVLVGYLAEEEKGLRREALAIADLQGRVRFEEGFRASVQAVLEGLMEYLGAYAAAIALQETQSARAFVWRFGPDETGTQPPMLELRELTRSELERYFPRIPPYVDIWSARRSGPQQIDLLALDAAGRRLAVDFQLPEDLLVLPWTEMIVVSLKLIGQEWSGSLIIRDPARPSEVATLRFLQALVRQVRPTLYNLYLVRRLRARAGALERARVARELHDGVIQALIGMEMQLEVSRRKAERDPVLAAELERIQDLLRTEVLNVRDLMHQMRPVEVSPSRLLEHLNDLVERFRRETGISARFVSELEQVALAPRTCRELASILQEALVNTRRHSGASNVVVRFGADGDRWRLSIDDDGRGFDFRGRLTLEQLDDLRIGPIVIKERVRSIGGELAIESMPGKGGRLEITLPRRRQEQARATS